MIGSEDDYERAIVQLGSLFGWIAVGSRPARTKHGWRTPWKYDGKGYPDLQLLHPVRGLVAWREIKLDAGLLSPEQDQWRDRLTALCDAAAAAEGDGPARMSYGIWRPRDAAEVGAFLSFGRVADWRV